ncbi:MAG TPA: DUF1905 domain-containing protein [Nocardioides sp.]|uniref:DUF1905 domain-containing protein n=1 Tax=Nocardioides sp. TaxID=35761 RepID=UPI002EDA82C8
MDAGWEFDAALWRWEGQEAAWVFLTVPEEVDDDIRLLAGPRHGFGSVRVEVTIGASTWRTSVFPDKQRGFVLPVKKDVRRREGVEIGDTVTVRLTLL